MPPDPARADDVREGLRKASSDLAVAEILTSASPPRLEHALFCCQQAAEKALKGFLAWSDRPFRKTHGLREIGAKCVAIDATMEPIARPAALLTEYAWLHRYPGEAPEPTVEEARRALGVARAVFDAVVARVPPEAGPR